MHAGEHLTSVHRRSYLALEPNPVPPTTVRLCPNGCKPENFSARPLRHSGAWSSDDACYVCGGRRWWLS